MSGQGWGWVGGGAGWPPVPHHRLGLGSAGVEVGKPTHFTVLTKGAGKAKLDVHFAGAAKGEAVRDFEIIDNHDYSYTVKYTAVQQVCPPLPCPACPGCPRSWVSSSLTGPLPDLGPFPASHPFLPWIPEPLVHVDHGHAARPCLSHQVQPPVVPHRATWQ